MPPTYDRIAEPQTRWGTVVLDRLPLGGDERVLDAGCGSGRVTERLLERLPDGRVVALDGSPSMIAEARRRLARFGDRVDYLVADLGEPLPIAPPVDAILSTATFHWVPDHAALFRNLAAVLRPGGRLVAQCGGVGNVASIMAVLATVGDGWLGPAHFETPEATRDRLAAAGFVDDRDLAERRAHAARAGRAVRDVPGHGGPRGAPRATAGGGTGRVRPRGRAPAAPARDRLRPAEHPGHPGRRSGRLSGAAPDRLARPRQAAAANAGSVLVLVLRDLVEVRLGRRLMAVGLVVRRPVP